MTTYHYKTYQNWKNISLVLLSSVLITLTAVQIANHYKIHTFAKKKAPDINIQDTASLQAGPLLAALKEIDAQDLRKTLEALIETLPPLVKIEKLTWNNKNELTLACRAQSEAGLASMLEACGKNNLLKGLHLKKSGQQDSSILFTLS